VSAITPPPPRGWVVVQDGRLVGRDAELLDVRGGWVPAIVDDGRRVGATRNRRSIDVIYPLDVPRWQRRWTPKCRPDCRPRRGRPMTSYRSMSRRGARPPPRRTKPSHSVVRSMYASGSRRGTVSRPGFGRSSASADTCSTSRLAPRAALRIRLVSESTHEQAAVALAARRCPGERVRSRLDLPPGHRHRVEVPPVPLQGGPAGHIRCPVSPYDNPASAPCVGAVLV
jgi:hypothetical protein